MTTLDTARTLEPTASGRLARLAIAAYGALAYAAFLVAFLYSIGFVGNVGVPKGIDDGVPGLPLSSAIVNVALLGLFGIQHSVMARPWFKRALTRIVPPAMERSTFVLATCAVLGAIFLLWQPMPTIVWEVQHPVGRAAIWGLFALGFGIVLYASFLIDHFDLFGLRQVYLHLRRRPYTHHPFAVRSLYRFVRHPLMVGFLIAFWAAPTMTVGHLLFSAVVTAYILVALRFEERDLVAHLGEEYVAYRRRTPALVPLPRSVP